MSQEFQVVVRKGRPYLRRKPYIYRNPTLRQQVHQGRFAKIAYDLFDQAKGYKDGIPIVAAEVKEGLTGKTIPKPLQTLVMSPFQYVDLLMQIEKRQLKGEKITLDSILKERRIQIRIVAPPAITPPVPLP